VRNTDLEAYAHQDLPFDHVVEAVNPPRAAHRHPLFQTMLVLQNTPQPAPVFPGLEAEAVHRFNGFIGAKFDVTITLSERGSHGVNGFDGATEIDGAHGIDGAIGFDGALFDAETVRLLVERWLRLIEALAATPDLQIGWPDLVGDAERTALLAAGCGRSRVVPERSLVELFTEQRRRTPGALAVTDGAARVDYAELDRRSDVLATVLREAGAVPERPVALLQSRGVEHVVSVLAVLKTGAFYVPLPENVPDARCSAILALTAATIVVVDPAHAGAAVLDGVPCVLRSDARPSRQTACPVQAHPDQLAYVMFTSGSTGTPKGVGITHGNIASFATDPRFEPADRERVLMHSPPSFDPSVYEMWVPLLSGGAAVVMPPGPLDPRALGRFIRRQDATSAVFTAEVFMLMAEEATTDLAHLRLAWSGGDVLRPGPVGALLGCGGRVRVANAFGGTESTVISTWQAVDAQLTASGPLPIGTPMDNVRVRVLDGRLRPVPSGVPGDIYLAGHGTARGYHGSPALTAERFHPDPYGPPGSRMYRTGDRGHLDRRHVLHYDDRGDSQVKISGHRVELGEIDAVLARHPDVAVAATVARATARGRMQLVAYTVTAGPLTSALRASIIAHLGSHLPRHMVPTHVVGVPRFPLTANGKVDHRELPAPPEQAVTLGGAVADPVGGADSANTHETALTGLFADVLGQPRFAAHDNFFHHGGHSLLASRLVSRIRSAIGVEVDLNSLFDHPTPAGMARHLNSTEHRAPSRPVLRRRREG
jgi:amino acid adenylation domain-containing protein